MGFSGVNLVVFQEAENFKEIENHEFKMMMKNKQ